MKRDNRKAMIVNTHALEAVEALCLRKFHVGAMALLEIHDFVANLRCIGERLRGVLQDPRVGKKGTPVSVRSLSAALGVSPPSA